MNEPFRQDYMPDRNTEYLLYQTLVGAWPISQERAASYMLKAIREAKSHTSWTDPQARFEEAVAKFVESVYAHPEFMQSVQAFAAAIRDAGRVNSLTQVLLKITTPGVPDFYQGNELWDYSLVDPDNRRPVNFNLRRALLAELRGLTAEQVMGRADEGLPKLWLMQLALAARRRRPDRLSGRADYRALEPKGAKARHALAFVRGEGAVIVVPRFPLSLAGQWDDTSIELPEGRWLNELTRETAGGGPQAVGALLRRFPVALLMRE
jgi:(1->4)-alpha-D-glucan 1-alpha-D-glucosylmutase